MMVNNNQNQKEGDNLQDIFSRFSNLKVTVIGDISLDAYWDIDTLSKEISLETGFLVNKIKYQRYSLAGAANVINNLNALRIGKIYAVGLIGNDLWGRELILKLQKVANTDFVLMPENFQTLVYCKPIRDTEINRFDFGGYNVLDDKIISDLLIFAEKAIEKSDVIIINQQINLIGYSQLLELLNKLVSKFPNKIFLADSRHFPELLFNCYLKLNKDEALMIVKQQDSDKMAKDIFNELNHRIYLTCGADGIIVADEKGEYQTTVIPVEPPIDTVGAGDTVISVLASLLGSGCNPYYAAEIANLAGSIVVKKLFVTGVVSQSELLRNINKIDKVVK